MTGRALAVAVAVVAAAAAAVLQTSPAAADTFTVNMPGRYFEPAHATVLVGDAVRWTNTSSEHHDVAGDDFNSGEIHVGDAFQQTFPTAGTFSYICTIHRFMAGDITVVPATLAGPAGRVARGARVTLRGRAAPGTPFVMIDAARADGASTPVAAVAPLPDGTFAATVSPLQTTSYTATVDGGSSAPVQVQVVDRIDVALHARRVRERVLLTSRIMPAQPGAIAALQLYSKDRYAWRQVAHVRLGRGAARFVVSARVRRPARLVLRDAGGGAVLAVSRPVRPWIAG